MPWQLIYLFIYLFVHSLPGTEEVSVTKSDFHESPSENVKRRECILGVVHMCYVHKQIKIINDSCVARVECLGGGGGEH